MVNGFQKEGLRKEPILASASIFSHFAPSYKGVALIVLVTASMEAACVLKTVAVSSGNFSVLKRVCLQLLVS